ncbi:MAG: HIT family hydrolase [Leptospiraceae bacterium]|nr:HIT family hydrolase [Leptospiraceae bacterium]
MECKICKTHQNLQEKEFIISSEYWILRHSEKEKNCPGYLYLEPKNHVESFFEIPESAWKEQGEIFKQAFDWIKKRFEPKKIYIVTISEAVPHIHYHIVPRYNDDTKGIPYLDLALTGKLPG